MKTKPLGRTGVQVSELCFGTMSFGGDADEATSAAMYKATRDAGINFLPIAARDTT
jgi:aryl-alcohol dehydrogenase-like predicted oxidoreductase